MRTCRCESNLLEVYFVRKYFLMCKIPSFSQRKLGERNVSKYLNTLTI